MAKLRMAGGIAGLVFGLELGALVWGAHAVSPFSISSADASLLAGWLFGQTRSSHSPARP